MSICGGQEHRASQRRVEARTACARGLNRVSARMSSSSAMRRAARERRRRRCISRLRSHARDARSSASISTAVSAALPATSRTAWRSASARASSLPTPDVEVIERSKGTAKSEADADETARLNDALARAREKADFIVIDTPGNDTTLSRVGHAAADTLVTPLNDSFLDFDLLAKFDPDSLEIKGPSLYSEFVWDCRKRRADEPTAPIWTGW